MSGLEARGPQDMITPLGWRAPSNDQLATSQIAFSVMSSNGAV